MASTEAIESHRAGAEVFTEDATCKKKSVELLQEIGIPAGLLPLEDIQEFGYNRDSGFFWIVQAKKVEHTFNKLKQKVSYDTVVTAFIEKGKLTKITGISAYVIMMWVSIIEVFIPEATPEKVTFKSGNGLSRTFDDATAFALGE